jgi:hypothetical protein
MATERQIQANRANAQKSTGPTTPEGKRISSQNGVLHSLVSGTPALKEALKEVLKGESMRRFNTLAAALMRQFQPRNSAETAAGIFFVQTMTAARWRLLRMWGIQTAGFQTEMARTAESTPSAGTGAVLAAATLRTLAGNSRTLALQQRFEAAYDRQYNHALAMLLKLRESPDPSASSGSPIQLATETREDDFQGEPNFSAEPETDLTSE